MTATFELQLAKDPFPFETEDDFFEPAPFADGAVHDLDLPVAKVGVPFVHFV